LRLLHGADIDGWIVIGEIDHQLFNVRASRRRLLALAERNPDQLADMVAAYEKTGHRR
jgi:hypothetical protein